MCYALRKTKNEIFERLETSPTSGYYDTGDTVVDCQVGGASFRTLGRIPQRGENDSRRKFWEVRAELLAYLINLDNRCSTALSSRRNFSGVQLLNSTPSIPHSFPVAVSDVRLETKASVSNVDSFKLSRGDMDITINKTDDLAFSVSPPLGCVSTDEPVIMVQPPVLRFHTPIASSEVKSLKDPTSSLIESDGNGVEYAGSWATFLETVDVVEKTFMVQNLVNDLKRWIYGFVSEWNN
ncbi:uncharacterized protein DEA37_0011259, partial [Paragonimus westermani]